MKAILVIAVLALSGATLAASPFSLAQGAQWPPSGTMTPARALNIRYAEAFAEKVELMLAVTGRNFFDLILDAKATAAIGLGVTNVNWTGAVDELTTTWRYGMMLWAWQGGWEGRP